MQRRILSRLDKAIFVKVQDVLFSYNIVFVFEKSLRLLTKNVSGYNSALKMIIITINYANCAACRNLKTCFVITEKAICRTMEYLYWMTEAGIFGCHFVGNLLTFSLLKTNFWKFQFGFYESKIYSISIISKKRLIFFFQSLFRIVILCYQLIFYLFSISHYCNKKISFLFFRYVFSIYVYLKKCFSIEEFLPARKR